MNEITPDERWNLSRKYIAKSLFDNFDIFRNGDKDCETIDRLIEAVAKDLNLKTEKVKYFLLADKIFEEHDIEKEVQKKIRDGLNITKTMTKTGEITYSLDVDEKEEKQIQKELKELEESKLRFQKIKAQAEIAKKEKQKKK